jgi:hypothetical protein
MSEVILLRALSDEKQDQDQDQSKELGEYTTANSCARSDTLEVSSTQSSHLSVS